MDSNGAYLFCESYAQILSILNDEDELTARRALDAYFFDYNFPEDMSDVAERAVMAIVGIFNNSNDN